MDHTGKYQIFIDGQTGTTGLQIRQRLARHPQIDVLTIDNDKRRDTEARRDVMSQVDITVLCLPDDAAKESAALAASVGCRVLDASTAHRVNDDWVFGLPELVSGQRQAIANATKVSNPGCYSTGAIMLLRPLIDQRLLSPDQVWSINAVSGYTGGGTAMIADYQQNGPAYFAYGLDFNHKHLPEMQKWARLNKRPIFQPAVVDCDQGMLIFIPIVHHDQLTGADLHKGLSQWYQGEPFVQVHDLNTIDTSMPKLTPHGIAGTNRIELHVFANTAHPDRSLLVAKLDNLGKGASGAAVQNLNIMLGLEEALCTSISNE